MSEEIIEKVGVLTTVAKTGGLHLDNNSKWDNPSEGLKQGLDIDKVRTFLNKRVKLEFNESGDYDGIVLLENVEKNKVEPKEAPKNDSNPVKAEGKCEPGIKSSETSSESYDFPEGNVGINFTFESGPTQEWDKDYFNKLNKVKCETEQKNGLTYVSWAHAWEQLKKNHPDANFEVHENNNGMPYFYDVTGGFVKVSVKVCGLIHTVLLPVMNYMNKSIKVGEMTTFDINKSIQRALTKAIALHGIGLYPYKGEDLPEDEGGK